MLAVFGRLRNGEATELVDLGQAAGAVMAGAREHDRDGALAMHFGQGAKEQVDHRGGPLAAGLGGLHVAVVGNQIGAGSDHVDMAGLQLGAFGHLGDNERREALQNFGRAAFVVG